MTCPEKDPYADLFLMLADDGEGWHRYISDKLRTTPAASTISQSWMLLTNDLELEDVSDACSQSSLVVLLATPALLERLVNNSFGFDSRLKEISSTGRVMVLPLLDNEGKAEMHEILNNSRYGYDSSAWTFLDVGDGTVGEVDEVIATMLNMVEECLRAKMREREREREERDRKASTEKETLKGEGQERAGEPGSEEEIEEAAAGGVPGPPLQRRPSPKPRRHTQQSRSVAESSALAEFYPATVYECNVDVAMVLKEKVSGKVTLRLDQADLDVITAQRRSSTLFTFTMPQVAPGTYTVQVFVDDTPLPSEHPAQLTVSGGPQLTFTSLHYLMQALGVATPQELDLKLKEVFNSSLPTDGCLRSIFDNLSAGSEQAKCHEAQYPTILHFAADHGLSEFCAALLECPGSAHAFHIPNSEGLHPDQLAERSGFHDLNAYISDFVDMLTANDVYGRYISMNPVAEQADDDDEDDNDSDSDYEQPLIAPISAPRIRKFSDPFPKTRSGQLPPLLETQHSIDTDTIDSPAARPERPPKPSPRVPTSGPIGHCRSKSERATSSPDISVEVCRIKSKSLPREDELGALPVFRQRPLPDAAVGSRSQSELIVLNEMVKNKEINLTEAEMLYNAWLSRYGQNKNASFKERQKEIADIKCKYNQIRQKQKVENKQSKSFLSRFGIHGRQNKQTVKVKITDPVLQRKAKQTVPRVYVKAKTASGKPVSTSQRVSTASTASSTSTASSSASSRDSGCSQGSRDSALSNLDQDSDGEVVDAVFMQEVNGVQRRTTSRTSSRKRLSLGHLYLQEARASTTDSSTDTPPPLPPRPNGLPHLDY